MGAENDMMLDYLRDNKRFADLFNGGLFGGEQVVDACNLQEAGENYTEYKRGNNSATHRSKSHRRPRTVSRTRDIKKQLAAGTELRILAIEEQSLIDYTMPWRCMNYDTLEYGKQVKDIQKHNQTVSSYANDHERLCKFTKQDKLAPVYTLCLYHGPDKWDGPRSLKDMVKFSDTSPNSRLEKYFADYPMNLICVNELENISVFTTGLKELFAIMPYRKDKKELKQFLETHEEYRHLDEETAEIISGVIGVRNFMENKERFQEGGQYNMCQAMQELLMDSWNDGVSTGIGQGIERGVTLSAAVFRAVRSGIIDNQTIAGLCQCPASEVENIRKAFDI